MAKLNIVLFEPEIPANTGNIGRTCVATGTSLHLIEPLGFRINEKELRRAGMDYWEHLDVTRYVNYAEFQEKLHRSVVCKGAVCSPRLPGIYSATATKKRAKFRKK